MKTAQTFNALDGRLRTGQKYLRRQWAKEILEQLRAEFHTLPLEDRLTVRRTLQEMAGEDEHER